MLRELPENVVLAKPFRAFSLLKADGATEEKDGKFWIRGPIAPPDEGEDFDKDVLAKAGVNTGLPMFHAMGSHVDWGHGYRAKKDPDYIIAKGHSYVGPDGFPWLGSELAPFDLKPLAEKAWRHVKSGQHAGYSIDGLCKLRDPQNPKRIIQTEIHMITVDPQPKGYGNFLEVGPPQSMQRIAKGFMADLDRGDLADAGWVPMPLNLDPDLYPVYFQDTDYAERLMKSIAHVKKQWAVGTILKKGQPDNSMPYSKCPGCGGDMDGEECPTCGPMQKALTTGSDVVTDGATGGKALRKQSLAGKVVCSSCSCRNDSRRPVCRRCAKPLEMQKALSSPGHVRCAKCNRKNDSRRSKCRGCGASMS